MGDWKIIGSGIVLDLLGIILMYLGWVGFKGLETTGLLALALGMFVTVVGLFTVVKAE